MWGQPHLNTQLFLNYKGFDAIEGLEDYVAVRSLHLGNNNIAKIEGLDRMSDLRSLHLECNRIIRIENLQGNLELRQLNLESNGIRCVECLTHLVKLEQLNLSKNSIEHLEDMECLRSIPSLANIDVSHNQLATIDGVVEFWAGLDCPLKVLKYHGNPGVRNIENYRKRLVNAIPALTYLDERPIFPVERRSCAAWAVGGLQAMQQAKRDFHAERHRAESFVDPERRELLTRMRKAAIARIEREAREREELEERRRRGEVPQPSSGGGTGPEPEEDAGVGAVPAPAGGPVWGATAPAYCFAPPQRTGSQGRAGAWAGVDGRLAGVSSFISCSSDVAGDMAERLADRQFALLGDDPWAGTAPADASLRRGVEREFRTPGQAPRPGAEQQEVMPLIWERLQASSKEAELKALQLNHSHERGEAGTGGVASPSAAEGPAGAEFASLD